MPFIKTLPPLTVTNPELASQFHPTKNGLLKASEITRSRPNEKLWWRCPTDPNHEWQALASARARGASCPYCTNRRLRPEASLAYCFPELSKEWHAQLNGELKPTDILAGTTRKVWWQCKKHPEHEWEAMVVNRTSKGKGCPYCAGRKVDDTNSIASSHPELVKEWHPKKNGKLTLNDITPGSQKRVWWICSENKDHEWQTAAHSRIGLRSGCPSCAGRKLSIENSLAAKYPEIAAEWHPTKNGKTKARDVLAGTHEKFYWLCPNSEHHTWLQAVSVRTSMSVGCPYCTGRKVAVDTCLRATHPLVANQWHPTRNGALKPTQVSFGSKKKVWWRCFKKANHVWQATVKDVVTAREDRMTTGCPYCYADESPLGAGQLQKREHVEFIESSPKRARKRSPFGY